MKVSDYVISFLEKHTDSLFLLSGGGIMHLVDSVSRSKLQAVCCHHEQAVATAAEGYARIKNNIGCCLVTTGPGGTNAITGVAGAWLDSIPMLVISGQVKTDNIVPRKNGAPTVRAIGFQELNVIDMIKPITKYAVTVEDPKRIRYEMEKAVYFALNGRPGPSWIEIPLDVQASEIEPKSLSGYEPKPESVFTSPNIPMDIVVEKLKNAKRPLLLVGNGIRLAGGVKVLHKVLEKFKFNTASVIFTADDIVTDEYSYYLGRQGMPGNKSANWAIDNCDVLLVIGDRLQLTQTSYEYQNFATQATKIMIDIDENELHKKTLQIDIPIHADAKVFLEELYKQEFSVKRWTVKQDEIDDSQYDSGKKYLNVYRFLRELSKYTKDECIATADGTASLAPHQALKLKKGQRFITNAGLGQMGSGLPLAIGVAFADRKKTVICMEGDGSLMLNMQEIQTAIYHNLPLKIFIYNNNGYYSIRNTHLSYFKKVFASDPGSGVSFPDYEKLMAGWQVPYFKIRNNQELSILKEVMSHNNGPIVCELMIDPFQKMLPKWSAGMYRGKKQ